MDQLDRSTIVLISTIIPALLVLVIMAVLVTICVCKRIKNKQNQLQQEVYYSVVGPRAPSVSEQNADMSNKQDTHPNESTEEAQTKNPAHDINITAMSNRRIGKSATAYDQRNLNAECYDTILLSSNIAYGTNVSIAPEIDCDINMAYERTDPNAECRNTMQLSSNTTNVATAPEINCEINLACNKVECYEEI